MLLKLMMKEEWRIHSTLFGNLMFALFPVILLILAFVGSLILPLFLMIIPGKTIAMISHYMFLLFGASVGGFGLFGREAMNRRFGQASLLAYSSRTLPISERSIFLDFIVKDTIFYFILWILPIVAGIGLALPITHVNLNILLILLTLTLSFLIGMSLVFILSTIYAHSSRLLVILIVLGTIAVGFNFSFLSLPSLQFFFTRSLESLYQSILLIIVPSALSIVFLKVDYPQKKRHLKNSFSYLSDKIGTKYSSFISKDLLDLHRSEGGVGKIIFSFLLPLLILWVMLSVFMTFLPKSSLLLIFSLALGIISPSIYNWLTEFDIFSSYAFLPVRVSEVIKGKLISYAIMNIISIVILIITVFSIGQYSSLLMGILAFISVSSYVLSVTLYLTGLYPNILLYNAKIFGLYILTTVPVLVVMLLLAVMNPFYLIISPLLILIALEVIKMSYSKWDTWEHPSF